MAKSLLKLASVFICLVGVAPLCAASANADDQRLKSLLQTGVDHGYPGFAMLVREPFGTERGAAAGYASIEEKRSLRVDDAFNLASVTKTFTTVATLRLADEGRLSLEARLPDVLPQSIVACIPNSSDITVRELLDHSSGIYATNNNPKYISTLLGANFDPKRVWPATELVALACDPANKPLGLPASGHYYSDTNYVLLGLIVERVSGRPFKKYVADAIFKPLGMDSTYFYSGRLGTGAQAHGRVTQGYLLNTKDISDFIKISPAFHRVRGNLFNTTLAGERIDSAAGIVSTLPDMMKYARALFTGKLLAAKSQTFLMAAGDGMEEEPVGKEHQRALKGIRKSFGVIVCKDGDGPGGVNATMAYRPATGAIYIGFTNSFGHFDEIDFMLDNVIGKLDRPSANSP